MFTSHEFKQLLNIRIVNKVEKRGWEAGVHGFVTDQTLVTEATVERGDVERKQSLT